MPRVTAPSAQSDARRAVDVFQHAAQLNRESPLRAGSVVRLPGYGQCVMTGDLHGHTKNFEKLCRYAMLDRVSARHVVLHEMIHAEKRGDELDHSHELLFLAAQYKCEFPEQVHFLQSNHELAQLSAYPIAKNGRMVIEDFNDGVAAAYGADRAGDVLKAMNAFIASFPLAVATANRIWMSHSLPNVHDMPEFDAGIFERTLTTEELLENRSVFNLVWGRRHTKEQLESLSERLGADVFLTGHQPQEDGYAMLFDRLIIVASDHSHGCFLPFDLSRPLTVQDLLRNIRKFVAVA